MKTTLKLFLMMAALGLVSTANASTSIPTKDVVIAINDVYVPEDISAGMEAFVVASGIFPNGCYKWKGAVVKHESQFTHDVTSVAAVSQGMCIQVLIPFTKEIKLGQLDAGRHMLRFRAGDGTYMEKVMVIR